MLVYQRVGLLPTNIGETMVKQFDKLTVTNLSILKCPPITFDIVREERALCEDEGAYCSFPCIQGKPPESPRSLSSQLEMLFDLFESYKNLKRSLP